MGADMDTPDLTLMSTQESRFFNNTSTMMNMDCTREISIGKK